MSLTQSVPLTVCLHFGLNSLLRYVTQVSGFPEQPVLVSHLHYSLPGPLHPPLVPTFPSQVRSVPYAPRPSRLTYNLLSQTNLEPNTRWTFSFPLSFLDYTVDKGKENLYLYQTVTDTQPTSVHPLRNRWRSESYRPSSGTIFSGVSLRLGVFSGI